MMVKVTACYMTAIVIQYQARTLNYETDLTLCILMDFPSGLIK